MSGMCHGILGKIRSWEEYCSQLSPGTHIPRPSKTTFHVFAWESGGGGGNIWGILIVTCYVCYSADSLARENSDCFIIMESFQTHSASLILRVLLERKGGGGK